VEPESSVRIYIFFRPMRPLDNTPTHSRGSSLSEAGQIPEYEEKKIEIYVNCRLVKDYQKIVYLRARCRTPQMSLSAQEFSFAGSSKAAGTSPSRIDDAGPLDEDDWGGIPVAPNSRDLAIRNMFSQELHYEIMNDTKFFLVEIDSDKHHFAVTPGEKQVVKITPNLEAISKSSESLRKVYSLKPQVVASATY
jgi:hypothetical protein